MALDGDVRRQALLARRGYRQTDLVLVRRSRMLDCPIAAPAFPAGFALEHIPSATFEHHERWAAAYRQAFEPEQMSVALRRAVAAAPLYRPELDLALRAPDGSLAAFALVWFDELTRSGTFEPLGCVPDQRRKGLSAALLREGLRRLRALGATTAFVTTAERRLPANRLYEAAGFGSAVRGTLWQALR
jgi:GNAT superfamily N-acetyltransferase